MRQQTLNMLRIAFTYMGTVVGAGFATGQEIIQFFTRFGWMGTLTIISASLLFVWLGIKIMLLAGEIGAHSYEDLNRKLFGNAVGQAISLFTMVILVGITSVMLAGAGSIFSEQLGLPYQMGLWVTMIVTYVLLLKGIEAIMTVNSIVVPCMLLFTAIITYLTLQSPGAGNFIHLTSEARLGDIWLSPLLYVGFNLALTQAVLVPLGAKIKDRRVIYGGGLLGGLGIGVMLLAGHTALSAHMPGIRQFEIPMGRMIIGLGPWVQLLYLFIIYAEIFTTYIGDVYGLALQLQQRTRFRMQHIVIAILAVSFLISQIGFSKLLSTLYPLFGFISMSWLVLIMWRRRSG